MSKLVEYKPGTAFPGVIDRTVAESSPAWPEQAALDGTWTPPSVTRKV